MVTENQHETHEPQPDHDDGPDLVFKDFDPERGDPAPEADASADLAAAESSAAGGAMKIEWFDEAQAPESGHLFAEAPPEPPLMSFEVIRESKSAGAPATSAARASAPHSLAHSPSPDAPMSARPPLWVRLFWGFLPLLLLLAGYGAVIWTQKDVGFAWDESYYYEPSLKAADWLTAVFNGDKPFSARAIDRAWSDHPEHPSIQKFLSGIALRAIPDPKLQIWAMRLPIAILFGLSLNLIYWLGRRSWGPVPGLIAALIYATMPRIFGHAHFAAMETPLIFMMLLVVFCFLRGLDSSFWAVMTGVSFGLLLATKINGFFLPVPLILWAHLYARRRYVNNLFAMLTLGPLVFVGAWPWLWHGTLRRILEYLAFHSTHPQTSLWFMGRLWGGMVGENAPWYYPSVIVAVTIPVTSLLLIVWGLMRTTLALPRRPMGALYLFCALVMLGVASAPSTPRYDGERLFLPVFPFLALLGGSGAVGLIALLQRLIAGRGRRETIHQRRLRRWATLSVVLMILLDGGGAIYRYEPYFLSYFNPLVGGLKGAWHKGFETTYWGDSLNQSVFDEINALPPGSSLMPLALNDLNFQQLQMWGLIDANIRIGGRPPYDYHLLQMRRGFFKRPELGLLDPRGPAKPVKIWLKDGVPLMGLFRTGPAFDLFWPHIGQ